MVKATIGIKGSLSGKFFTVYKRFNEVEKPDEVFYFFNKERADEKLKLLRQTYESIL